MKKWIFALFLCTQTNLVTYADDAIPMEFDIGEVELRDITHHEEGEVVHLSSEMACPPDCTPGQQNPNNPFPPTPTFPPNPNFPPGGGFPFPPTNGGYGDVIGMARNLVALGREIYELVKLGQPVIQSDFPAISVMPLINKSDPASVILDTAGWSFPEMKEYSLDIKSKMGTKAIGVKFQILYSYGGSYLDKGKYLTGVQIIPSDVFVDYGFELNSTFRLQSIQNHGSVADPIAGALVTLQYKGGSMFKKFEKNIVIHVTGDGKYKMY
ncbi:MAG: hypothetical protein JNM93_12855 [Bacteriovoracaceae bacterium]|nr:hypothetical protein [Bacteriovoracaceae bacterium]